MPKVKVNDIEMYYEIHGEGEPLLMLHGITGSTQMWNNYVNDYKQHFQLIIPDLRGHGKSTNSSKEFTAKQSAHDIIALLGHLGVTEIKGIGCSTGGDILLHIATMKPEMIVSMVLDGATPYYPKQMREACANWTLTEGRWERYRKRHYYGDEQIRQIRKYMVDLKDSYDDVNFTKPLLSTIQAKTLIILGDRDPYYPVKMATTLYESIPDSYLWIVPKAGHALTMYEIKLVKPVALDFLSGKWEVS